MIFRPTSLSGLFLILPQRIEDERGFFARTWCEKEAAQHGIKANWVQSNTSLNRQKGTLRGLHYQAAPHEEAKLVRCTRGAIFDVAVDIRKESPSFGRWEAATLSAENGQAFYIPAGFAHGFQTLSDDSEVLYLMSAFYHPELSRGILWNDPKIGIKWPSPDNIVVSAQDSAHPLLNAAI